MPELRQDPWHGRWVILAPERRNRPDEYARGRVRPGAHGPCPFCPGNERETPPEVLALRPGGSPPDGPGWEVRAFPNRYPALATAGAAAAAFAPLIGLAGTGIHEVVVESAAHGADLATLAPGQVAMALGVYQARLRALRRAPGVRYVLVFRNSGAEAGATHLHPHGQLLALPLVPPLIERETELAVEHRRLTGRCLSCAVLEREIADGSRVVAIDDAHVALCPWAARVPYELLVAPRSHLHTLSEASPGDLERLAGFLRALLGGLRGLLGEVPYNLAVHDSPRIAGASVPLAFHWHLEVVPRLGTTGGFEWGSDCFINTLPPEEAAAGLRHALGR